MPSERIEQRIAEDGVPYWTFVKRGFLSLSGENFVDYHDVYAWMQSLVTEHELYPLKVGYDRYSSQYLIKDLEGAGFQCDSVYQGDNLWPVLQEMEGLIKDGRIRIGDNDLLKSHLLNAAIKMSIERGRGRLVKINQRARIDGVAALADAMTVRQKWYAEIGYQLQNEG
jgi:phage terminase large subunit-like protein